MSKRKNQRRDFIKLVSTGAPGSEISWDAASYARVIGANDRIGVGVVGFSERAQEALIPALAANAEAQNFEIVAVSDIWRQRREEGAAFLNKLTGKTIAQARNNDELFEMKE